MLRLVLLLLVLGPCGQALACLDAIGQEQGVSPQLLRAIIAVESGGNPRAVHRNGPAAGNSRDLGAMQINSAHLPALRAAGIDEAQLFDYCTNVRVGSGLLRQHFVRYGLSWEAVGANNAGCARLPAAACQRARRRYAWRVYHELQRQSVAHLAPAQPTPALVLQTVSLP